MRVIDYFDRGADIDPDRPCLIEGALTRTFREVRTSSHLIALTLIDAAFAPQEKAAVLSPNCATAFECVLGIFRAEGVWVPINMRNAEIENAIILDDLDVTVLFFHSSCANQVAYLRARCPKIRLWICINGEAPDAPSLAAWVGERAGLAPERGCGREALATISSTGGTTGRPKGVMWSNLTWQTYIGNFHTCFPLRQPHVHLVVAPMTHAAGTFAIVLMAAGATNVILPGFDAEAVISAIPRHRVTTMFLPPTAIYTLLAHPRVREGNYTSLAYFYYTSAPMSAQRLREAVDVFGPVMTSMYGQVEAPATCTYLPPWELVQDGRIVERRIASCGRPSLHTRVAIMADDGTLLPAGQAGEIVVRSNLVMTGYYRNEAATAEVSHHGWHHTGDIGYFDDTGYLFIVDRKKDMIISGGFNVYPSEVEQVLWTHPAVQDCAVIGVPDEKWGEAVKAVIELKPHQHVAEADLIDYSKQRLGSIKAPKSIEFWDELPRSAAGKVLRKAIRERYWHGQSRLI